MNSINLREGDGILMVRLGAVGDVVRTLPCLARLREAAPRARIAWVVEPPSSPLLPVRPWLDQVFVFPRDRLKPADIVRNPGRALTALQDFRAGLRAFRARISVDFQGTAKSSAIALLAGAPERLGFDRSGSREGSFLLSNLRVKPSSPRLNRVHKNLELISLLAAETAGLRFPYRDGGPSERVEKFLRPLSGRTLVAVHPGTSRRQRHKQWPAERYGQIAASLAHEGCLPILTWGPGEEDLIEIVQSRSRASAVPTPSLDVDEMRQVIARCRLFVGGDTGPMHLAWSQGVPVVALFGSTDPSINGPLGEGHQVLAPAWEISSTSFPSRGDASAVQRISVDRVRSAIVEALSRRFVSSHEIPGR
ncbi:MAG TPA: glycosyltransferase family 9 protein [Candidatus Polarisedimenticolia bacterium]|nr:glycosyltransferase family 9 protein [Candidatus Polarisedimenticolia bacterium]